MSSQAIILFAHGARDPAWAAPFFIIQGKLQAARPDVLVLAAFQNFIAPTLAAAAAQAAAAGAKRISVVPLFLAQGGHMQRDLPLLLAQVQSQHPQLELRVLPAIGDAPEMLQAIADWVLRSA